MKNQFSQILKSYSAELALLKSPSLTGGERAKQKKLLQITILGTIATALLTLTVGFFTGQSIQQFLMGTVVVVLLLYLYILLARFLTRHEDAEDKLHAMAATIEERNRELKHLVLIDPLTEVMNRRGFERVLKIEIERAARNKTKNFALLIDCDDFKGINEKYGHSVGDLVLQEVSSRLVKAVRPSDHVARIGGDEFLILLSEIDTNTALQVAERVRLSVAETPINLAHETTKITTSTGIIELANELLSIEEILASGNAGLKSSKRAGKNSVSFSNRNETFNELAVTLEKLRSGECLRAVYQPISQLTDQQIIGYELQCRAEKGVFEQPDAFYKLAREHNLRTPVDLRCLKICLENLSKLPDKSPGFINVFAATLFDIPLDNLETIFDVAGQEVCVVIHDNDFLAEPMRLFEHVQRLKELGVNIALGQGGAGFNSFASLLMLEPRFIRIEKEAVKNSSSDVPTYRAFVSKLVRVASQLNCLIIADGIESKKDLDAMSSCGVQLGQGAFWGLPVQTD